MLRRKSELRINCVLQRLLRVYKSKGTRPQHFILLYVLSLRQLTSIPSVMRHNFIQQFKTLTVKLQFYSVASDTDGQCGYPLHRQSSKRKKKNNKQTRQVCESPKYLAKVKQTMSCKLVIRNHAYTSFNHHTSLQKHSRTQ